jgi:DNA-binding winged helix-turn-helix (wHTH) protein/TolB-like protein
MSQQAKDFYEFGNFKIDSVERVLLCAGEPVPLTQKIFDLLLLLVQNSGHVVEKNRLMKEIWPDTFVEEGNLTQNISVLRKVLNDAGHQYIQTVPRRGYRFVGHLREIGDESELIIEEHSVARLVVEEHDRDAPDLHPAPPNTVAPLVSIGKLQSSGIWSSRRTTLLTGLALVAAASVFGYFWFSSSRRANRTTPAGSTQSIAVLPFRVLSSNANDEFLGLGMTDALISKLSGLKQLRIRPTAAVRKYAATNQDAAAIGQELRVDSVLGGSVQRDGDRIRVTVQLIDAADGKVRWTSAFDEKFTDIFSVEDAISQNLAQAMAVKLSEGEQTQLLKRVTHDPDAYAMYLQGRFNLNKFTEEGTRLARQYFEQAIRQDPDFAQAYAGLAESYAFGEIGLPPGEAFPKARDAANKAIALDEQLGQAHAALAQVAFLWDWDWSAADAQFKRAIELSPGDPEIHHMYAHYLTAMDRPDEALGESQRLLELDPLSPASRNHLGWHYLYTRQYDQAIQQYKLVLAIDPNFTEAHRQLSQAYKEVNKLDEAADEMCKRYELMGRGTDAVLLKQAYVKSGWNGLWQMRHEIMLKRSKEAYVSPSGIACSYAGLKDKPHLLEWLARAYRERDHDLVYAKVDQCWDSVRSEPQFQELMKKMKLER